MAFEDKKFCQKRTLKDRWDQRDFYLINRLLSEGRLLIWNPDGREGSKPQLIDVQSVLEIEKSGYLDVNIGIID